MNFVLRVISSTVLLPVALFVLSSKNLNLLFCSTVAVSIVCFFEYGKIIEKENKKIAYITSISGAFFCIFLMIFSHNNQSNLATSAMIVVLSSFFTLSGENNKKSIERLSLIFFSLPYIGIGLSSFYLIKSNQLHCHYVNMDFIYLGLVISLSHDIFAYIFGKLFGKRKLCMFISKNKTWEGLIFGIISSILTPVILKISHESLCFSFFSKISIAEILFVSFFGAALAPIGDLLESKLKRSYNVKDSGKIIPGHGGILDRVDGVILVMHWILIYLFLLKQYIFL